MKVFIIQRIFSHYRKAIFDKLYLKLEIKLIHTDLKTSIKQAKTHYSQKVGFYKYGKSDTHVFINTFGLIWREKPDVIIHEFAMGIISLIPTYLMCKSMGIKFILWGHGYNRKRGFYPKKVYTDKIMLYLMQKADALLLYGQKDKNKLSNYVDENKIFIAQNTLDTDTYLKLKEKFEKEKFFFIKKRLNFKKKYNIIFIGRLTSRKNPELLIDIYENITIALQKDIAVHIVGSGEMENLLRTKLLKKGYQNSFVFYGEILDPEKVGELLYASDLMVSPGHVGLSVNHAFCFDTPVLTLSEKLAHHSPEIEYVIDNKTGFLINNISAQAFAEKIEEYILNPELQMSMKRNINECVMQKCSIENMVQGFLNAIGNGVK